MEAITSSLLRSFSEKILTKNKYITTVPPEQSPRKYELYCITHEVYDFMIKFVEVRLLLDLDVIRPWGNSHPSTKLGIGVGQYECFLCALEKRYYRYTRKINFEEHFEKHSIGKSFKNFFQQISWFREFFQWRLVRPQYVL